MEALHLDKIFQISPQTLDFCHQVVHGHTKQLEKLQGLSDETKKRLENNETELAKVELLWADIILQQQTLFAD